MNIFVLDKDPVIAVSYHNDKHIIKMILESTQMLMSTYHLTNSTAVGDSKLYKLSHKHHPCTKRVNASFDNWELLFDLVMSLNYEWKCRYNHIDNHLSIDKLNHIVNAYDFPNIIRN